MPYRSDFFTAKQTSPGVYDRTYTADRFANRFNKLFTNGVIVNAGGIISNELAVSKVTGTMKTSVNYGSALINGYMLEVYDAVYELTHVAADATYSRIDSIVMELNLTDAVRGIDIKILSGVPAASPVAPTITRTSAIYQLVLANITIPANVSSLNTATLTDKRSDDTVCGIANINIGIKPNSYALTSDLTTHASLAASATVVGHVELATDAETLAGTDTGRAITPSNLKAKFVDYGNIITKAASATLALTDANKVITMTGASSQTLTIPPNSSVAFPIGTQITVIMNGAGAVVFAPGSGVTLTSKDTKRTIDGQYASASLIKTATDSWSLIGALKA